MTTLYDKILTEAGNAPAWPDRANYTTVHGYSNGKALGTFGSVEEAKKNGATVTEKVFDEDGYKAARKLVEDHKQAIVGRWLEALYASYSNQISKEIFDVLYADAYDRGHSAGYHEVELYMDDLVDLAVKIIKLSN